MDFFFFLVGCRATLSTSKPPHRAKNVVLERSVEVGISYTGIWCQSLISSEAPEKSDRQPCKEPFGMWKMIFFCVYPWLFPRPVTVTTRIITYLVGDSNLNLHLPLLLGGGHTQCIPNYSTIRILSYMNFQSRGLENPTI